MFKKIVLFFAILLSLVISCGKIAYADTGEWARILTDNVHLYASADTKQELFELEKSYYVSIIDKTDTMYQVAVMPEHSSDFVQIIGWVRKSDVSLCATAPIEPTYPTEKLTVTTDSVDLKLSPVPSATTTCAILNMQQVCYYGTVSNYGKTWYYVRYAGRFGYVEANGVSTPDISLHPTPLPQTPANTTPTTPPDPKPEKPESNAPTSEILLIVFIVVLAVGLTLALFLPGNVKKKDTVFEQDI